MHKICVIANSLWHQTLQQLLRGVIDQAYACNRQVHVFTCMNVNVNYPNYYQGEMNILSMIPFSDYDGVLLLTDSFHVDEFEANLKEILQTSPVPVFAVNGAFADYPCNELDDIQGFKEVIRHLITVHDAKTIYCLTGLPGFSASEHRIQAFREVMQSFDLPCPDSAIFYGDFWKNSARELGERLASGEIPMPDAVVCGNDIMAISLCDTLYAHGISVPDDIAVTGFDGIEEAICYIPKLTTYCSDYYGIGADSVCRLLEITGETVQRIPSDNSSGLEMGCTCGCQKYYTAKSKQQMVQEQNLQWRQMIFRNSNLSGFFHETAGLDAFVHRVFDLRYVCLTERNIEHSSIYLCLGMDWEDEPKRTRGICETSRYYEPDEKRWHTFSAAENILPMLERKETLSVSYFSSLHYQDRIFGYIVLSFTEMADCFDLLYQQFCVEVKNGLERIRVQNALKNLSHWVQRSEEKDILTGLYREKYLPQFLAECLRLAESRRTCYYLAAIQIAGLQQLKDRFGNDAYNRMVMDFSDLLQSLHLTEVRFVYAQKGRFYLIGCGAPEEILSQIQSAVLAYNLDLTHLFYLKLFITHCTAEEQNHAAMQQAVHAAMEARMRDRSMLHFLPVTQLWKDIYAHPEVDYTIENMSKRLHMSASSFRTHYRKLIGNSAAEDIKNSRMKYAKRLLTETDQTIAEIAEACGYDACYFMHMFKRETGMPPAQYRMKE